ncbi:MAG TPA: DUF4358 domain-containing protein [Firmicutes bacterium]|nr:DUF4358 domain-containing protein [Bacillota bacterium]
MKCLRKITAAVCCAALVMTMGACAQEKTEINIADTGAAILEQAEYPEMVDHSDQADYFYDGVTEYCTEIYLQVNATGGEADELAIFRLSSAEDADAVKEICTARQDALIKAFDGYREEEMPKVENALILSKGDYILFAVTENTKEAEQIFQDAFKQ